MMLKTNSSLSNILRFFIYALLFLFIAKVIESDMIAQSFKESSNTEHTQELLILTVALLSYFAAYKFESMRYFFVGLGSFAALSFVRELDAWFESNLFDKGWQVFAVFIIIPTLYILIKNRKQALKQVDEISKSSYFKMLILGVFVLHAFSRLYGRSKVWKQLLETDYKRIIKDASEESTELLGYMLIFIATVELVLWGYRKTQRLLDDSNS